MTKHTIIEKLMECVETGKLNYEVERSVLRTLGTNSEDRSLKEEQVTQKEEK